MPREQSDNQRYFYEDIRNPKFLQAIHFLRKKAYI